MAKNSIFDPTKDGVTADNSGYSSNQIDKMIGESAAAVIDDDAAGDDTVYSSAKIYSLLPEDTATGAEVTITDGCPDLPIVELRADINAVQEGTGDPSPDNVRPISGWDEITITHDDIDVEISLGDNTIYGGTYKSDGTLTITHALLTYTAGLSIQSINQYNIANIVLRDGAATYKANSAIGNYLNSQTTTIANTQTNGIFNNTGAIFARIATSICGTTLSEINTYLSEHPLDVLIELATPTTLTIGTLAFNTNGEGSTIISCDSGDVTVTYKKLTTLS